MNKTWKEFKAEVDALLARDGLDENVELSYIDVGGHCGMFTVDCEKNTLGIEG